MTARRAPTTTPATRRAILYARQSHSRPGDELGSCEVQLDMCRKYAESQRWDVVGAYFDEGVSGSHTQRAQVQRLLQDVRAGKADVVVCTRICRLSRSLRDFIGLMGEFETHGTAFASSTQAFDSGSSLGKMTMGLLAVFAEFERSQTIDRTVEKIQASRRRGMWTGGNPPMGYDVASGKLVVNPAAAVVVRDLYAAYLQTGSALKTARLLNERGYRTRRGQPWDKARVLTALRSPVMCGCINADDEVVEGQHEGIVDRATWDAAQAMLNRHPARSWSPPSRNAEYLLAGGIARCGGCGAALTPGSSKARGRTWRFYRCSTRNNRGDEGGRAKPFPAAALEDFVVERIRHLTADGELAADVAARLTKKLADERAVVQAQARTLGLDLDRLAKEQGKLVEALTGSASVDARRAIEDRLATIRQERDAATERRAQLDERLAGIEGVRVDIGWVAQALADFDLVWENLTPLNRQRLVRALVRSVVMNPDAGTMTVTLIDLSLDTMRAAS